MGDLMMTIPMYYMCYGLEMDTDGMQVPYIYPCPNCTVQSMIMVYADGACVDIPIMRVTHNDRYSPFIGKQGDDRQSNL